MTVGKGRAQARKEQRNANALQRWTQPINTARRRWRAWLSLLFADHGFLRPVYWNSAEVSEGIWRGPQPNSFHLRTLARRGLKTIVNLRGKTIYGSYALEREAAEKLGLKLIDLKLYSGGAPVKEQIHALHAIFKNAEKPILFHCKSGADRSGLAAALYLIMEKNRPAAEAARELSLRYGHIKSGRTGILDLFFEIYAADNARRPMPFMQWVDEVYDPQKLNAQFLRPGFLRMLVDLFIRRE